MIRCPQCARGYEAHLAGCPGCAFAPPSIEGFPAWAAELAHGGGGFKAEYFEHLAALEAGSFWFRARNSLIVWALQKHFPAMRSFMEVGCGTGFVLAGVARAFPDVRLAASEVFSAGVAFAAGRVRRAALMQMDARRIPYEDEFDVIGAFDVIEHIEDDAQVIAQMRRALKPGGGLILTVPQHPRLWSAADEYAHHVRRYTAADLHAKLRAAGFDVVRSTSFVTLLLPAMLLSRMSSGDVKRFDPGREFRMPKLLNRTLEALMGLELWAIRIGASLPVGGSRLVVARRSAG